MSDETDFLQQLPPSLKQRRGEALESFAHARDPFYSLQLKAMQKTEAQRREESGNGSMMVKLHKPFPELRPKHTLEPLRHSFNQAWLRERRAAHMCMQGEQNYLSPLPENKRQRVYNPER